MMSWKYFGATTLASNTPAYMYIPKCEKSIKKEFALPLEKVPVVTKMSLATVLFRKSSI
jgi:hypothetical protein